MGDNSWWEANSDFRFSRIMFLICNDWERTASPMAVAILFSSLSVSSLVTLFTQGVRFIANHHQSGFSQAMSGFAPLTWREHQESSWPAR